VDTEEELSQPSIRPVRRISLSKSAELIKRMSSELAGDLKVSLTEKQVKLLYLISKLKELMDNAIYALVEEVNN